MTCSRLRGRPRLPVRILTASSNGSTWARSSPLAGVVRLARGMPPPSVRLWMRIPLPFPPRATPSPPPFPGGKSAIDGAILPMNHPTFLSNPQHPRLHRSQGAIRLPPLQPAMRGALRPPLGAVRDSTPAATRAVIKMYNKVFRIFRNGAWGIPRLRFGGAGGKTSSNKRHSKSLTPSNRPAILPSYVQIEQHSTKIILVG